MHTEQDPLDPHPPAAQRQTLDAIQHLERVVPAAFQEQALAMSCSLAERAELQPGDLSRAVVVVERGERRGRVVEEELREGVAMMRPKRRVKVKKRMLLPSLSPPPPPLLMLLRCQRFVAPAA